MLVINYAVPTRIHVFSADLNVFVFEVSSHSSGEVPLHFCVIREVPGGSF